MKHAARILVPRSFNDTFVIHYNPSEYLSLRFYRLHLQKGEEIQLISFLNSTLMMLMFETLGNKSLGQGALDFFMADFLALRLPVVESPDLEQVFNQLNDRPIYNVWDECGIKALTERANPEPMLDRRALDDIIFDELKLTRGERDAVYEAVIDLVEARLNKAKSFRK